MEIGDTWDSFPWPQYTNTRFGLSDIGQNGLESNTAVARQINDSSTVIPTIERTS
jgi:hypothetical protein